MRARTSYPAGVPCWVDVVQDDHDGGSAFYTELLGWTYQVRTPPGSPWRRGHPGAPARRPTWLHLRNQRRGRGGRMHTGWLLVLDVVGVLLVAVLLLCVALLVRRRIISRAGGTFEVVRWLG